MREAGWVVEEGYRDVGAFFAFWPTDMSYGNYNILRKNSHNLNLSYTTISDLIKPQHKFSIIFGCSNIIV